MCLLFARILPTEHHLASQEGKNDYATYQCMYEHNLYSLRYLCTFSYSKNNSKFTRSLLKIYVCDVNKALLSMKVKYVYVIQNRKYTGGTVQEKKFGTPFGSYLISFIFISTLFLYCATPMEHFNFTCMVEINNLGVCKDLEIHLFLCFL